MKEEHKKKISLARMGHATSKKTRLKIGLAMKGVKPFNFGKHLSDATKEKLSKYWTGKKRGPRSEETKKKISIGNMGNGHTQTIQTRKKISNSLSGDKSHLWKGGVTPINMKIRKSLEYKLWRTAVFERDNYTCIWCGKSGVNLNADHIKPFCDYPELRFAIDNGRTLCVDCHKTTDTYGVSGKLGRSY